MDTEYLQQYVQEMEKRCNESSIETLNESSECKTSNDNKCSSISKTLNEHYLPRKNYFEMLFGLEELGVFKPKSLFFKYGLEHCYRIYKYVMETPAIKNKGAYFRVLLKKTA